MNIELYTKDDCAFCHMAKMALYEKNIPFTEQRLFVDFFREEIIEKFPHAKSFPIIVVDGFYIGGYNQLKEYLEEQVSSNKTFLSE